MEREVKCVDTGLKLPKSLTYNHITISKKTGKAKNEYWSSEAAYRKHEEEVSKRQECINIMFEILGYNSETDKISTCFYKFLEEYRQMGFGIVLETIKGERDKLEWAVNHKEFQSDYAEIRYLMTIIQNNVMSYKQRIKFDEAQMRFKEGDFIPIDIPADFDLNTIGRTVKKNNNVVNNILGDI